MKSLALSLLVALGVSLGTVNAFADSSRATTQLDAAAVTTQRAQEHEALARQHRAAAQVAEQNARTALKVMQNDLKQGFTYEAGVERKQAAKFELEASHERVYAAREDAIAAQLRAEAQREMAQYQQTVSMGMRR